MEAARIIHRDYLADAEYLKQVNEILKNVDPKILPIDQSREMRHEIAPQKRSRALGSLWRSWKRWPWFVATEERYTMEHPPWVPQFNGGNFNAKPLKNPTAITQCLRYCLENSKNLPAIAPVLGYESFSFGKKILSLPPCHLVRSAFIPRDIVKQYKKAQCCESLVYVFQCTGGPEMDHIRRLIIAPNQERVAEAYAIATGQAFTCSKISDPYKSNVIIAAKESDAHAPVPQEMFALERVYPNILSKSVNLSVLNSMLKRPDVKGWSAGSIAECDRFKKNMPKGKGASPVSIRRSFKELESVGLVKSDGEKTAKRWCLGPSSFK